MSLGDHQYGPTKKYSIAVILKVKSLVILKADEYGTWQTYNVYAARLYGFSLYSEKL